VSAYPVHGRRIRFLVAYTAYGGCKLEFYYTLVGSTWISHRMLQVHPHVTSSRLGFHKKAANFVTSWAAVNFSRRIVLHGLKLLYRYTVAKMHICIWTLNCRFLSWCALVSISFLYRVTFLASSQWSLAKMRLLFSVMSACPSVCLSASNASRSAYRFLHK
jgi:hypothetical protein